MMKQKKRPLFDMKILLFFVFPQMVFFWEPYELIVLLSESFWGCFFGKRGSAKET